MRARQIAIRSLTYYWRTNVAVVLGVATAVSVLAGALLVGDSVRGSLRDLLLGRLGRTDHVIASTSLFREQLAQDLVAQPEFKAAFSGVTPLVIVQGTVTAQNEGRRMSQARVYGVDDRFWQFHGIANVNGPANRDALISPALARQLDARAGDSILVRVQRPTDIPLESLHGQRDKLGRSMRLTVANVVPADSLGEFSLEAQQGEVVAVFVPAGSMSRSKNQRCARPAVQPVDHHDVPLWPPPMLSRQASPGTANRRGAPLATPSGAWADRGRGLSTPSDSHRPSSHWLRRA